MLTKAAIDDVFFMIKIKPQTTTAIKNNFDFKNSRIPKKVATPFPPLNFIKIEKQCPIIIKIAKSLKIGPKNLFKITRVKKPFMKSKINVKIADFFDPTRHMFVAPGFFEPASKGFSVSNILLNIIANGIDPIK
jgi:hypothetical protein